VWSPKTGAEAESHRIVELGGQHRRPLRSAWGLFSGSNIEHLLDGGFVEAIYWT